MSADTIHPIRTLLVEDDPDLLEVASGLLELSGCDVTSVHTPEEALGRIGDNGKFELLFTDYRFPGALNGVELANQATGLTPDMKVIIATGFDQQTIQSQAGENYRVIYKPYRLEALKALLGQLFPSRN